MGVELNISGFMILCAHLINEIGFEKQQDKLVVKIIPGVNEGERR